MAGRGTDIKLGPGVTESKPSVVKDEEGKDVEIEECGGLHIIGSERHESRRIDRQLRGRAGRQGDPGASQFFLSLEDDLMRLFGSERIARLMDRMGAQEGEVLTHPLITRSIETAQKRVELQNFQSRKRLLEYDDVMNQQREVVYSLRTFALEGGEELKGEAAKMIEKAVKRRIETQLVAADDFAHADFRLIGQELLQRYLLLMPSFENAGEAPTTETDALRVGTDAAHAAFNAKMESLNASRASADGAPRDMAGAVLAHVMLGVLDEKWKDHLYDLDQLRNSIRYRAWGQRDPLIEYKHEAYTMFEDLMHDIHSTFAERFLRAQIVFNAPRPPGAPGGAAAGFGTAGRSARQAVARGSDTTPRGSSKTSPRKRARRCLATGRSTSDPASHQRASPSRGRSPPSSPPAVERVRSRPPGRPPSPTGRPSAATTPVPAAPARSTRNVMGRAPPVADDRMPAQAGRGDALRRPSCMAARIWTGDAVMRPRSRDGATTADGPYTGRPCRPSVASRGPFRKMGLPRGVLTSSLAQRSPSASSRLGPTPRAAPAAGSRPARNGRARSDPGRQRRTRVLSARPGVRDYAALRGVAARARRATRGGVDGDSWSRPGASDGRSRGARVGTTLGGRSRADPGPRYEDRRTWPPLWPRD